MHPSKPYRTGLAIHFYGSGTVKAGVRVRHEHWKGGYTNFGSQRILSLATEKSRIMYESVCGFTTSSTPEGPKSTAQPLMVAEMKPYGGNVAFRPARLYYMANGHPLHADIRSLKAYRRR